MQTSEKIRAGRAVLGWSQQSLADHSGVSKPTIAQIELGREPEASIFRKLTKALENEGIFFSDNSVEKRDLFIQTFSNYSEVLDDIGRTMKPGDEINVHCADDRRSDDEVNNKLRELREAGYRFRITICEGNEYITGSVSEYRQIDKDYFASSDVTVIYGRRIVQHVKEGDKNTFVVVNSSSHAAAMRKQFEYWWKNGRPLGGNP